MIKKKKEKSLCYVRYADCYKKGVQSEQVYIFYRKEFRQALNELKLAETYIELIRAKPRKILVLSLVLSLSIQGQIEIRAPFNRWKRKLSLKVIIFK